MKPNLSPAELAEFRKLDSTAQLKALRGSKVERVFTIERDGGIDEKARTAWLSIASEEPYERWWGVEVLDVRKASIRDARLKAGAALLVNHDTDRQVGVVESYEITSDKRLRILARFGSSAYAEEIWRDVLEGIRRNTSVGYIIHDLVLEKQEETVSTYRVTDWEPLEGSLVAVPADPSVGVGRSHEPALPPQPTTKEKSTMDEKEKAAQEARAAEQKRVSDILAAGKEFKDHGGNEVALELISDASATVETFRQKMLAKMKTTVKPTATGAAADQPKFGQGARQIIRRGAQLRAFTKPVRYTDGTSMEAEEAAYRSGMWLLATIGQSSRAQNWCKDHGVDIEQHRVMTTDSDTAGGFLVPDEMEQSVIDLREDYGLARRLARRRPMASDTKSVPKRTGGVTAYFINEDNAGVTASDKSWGNVNFVAKTLAALSLISKNLEEDSIIDTIDDLAREMAYAFATKEDQCWLIGDGTSTYGGMTGLKTLFEATAYASRFTSATGHDTHPEYDNSDLTGVMGGVADFPGLNPVWLCSKNFAETVFGRLKATAGGVTGQGLEVRQRYGYGGYEAYTTEIMPKDPAADQTNVVPAFFGDFALSSSFGDRRGIMVQVLRERYAEKLQVGVLASERFHVINHDVGTTAVKGPVAALFGNT